MSNDNAKRACGYHAAEQVRDGMVIGIGTGSTAFFFIEKLIQRVQQENLKIEAIATSIASKEMALKGGIKILDEEKIEHLDLDIDGADEIDPLKRMIKGGGGALFREKIVASSAKEMLVIVDSSKIVEKLGKHPLPVEILPYGLNLTLKKINSLGLKGNLRKEGNNLYLTDNKNYIYDLFFDSLIEHPEALENDLKSISGVVETGLFLGIAKRVVIGYEDGSVEIKD